MRRVLLAGLVALLLIVGVARLDVYPFSLLRSPTCGEGLDPRSDRSGIDEQEYRRANLALLRTLPKAGAIAESAVTHHGYTRCPEGEGDVIGVRTTQSYDLGDGASKCQVAVAIEDSLRKEGWSVDPLETADQSGTGRFRLTKFTRAAAHVEAGIDAAATRLSISVDHRFPFGEDAQGTVPPTSPFATCTE